MGAAKLSIPKPCSGRLAGVLTNVGSPRMASNIEGVKVEISVVLGRSVIPMHQLLRMGRGAVIELDSKQDDTVLIMANDRPVARGEIIIQGDRIGVSITELLKGHHS